MDFMLPTFATSDAITIDFDSLMASFTDVPFSHKTQLIKDSSIKKTDYVEPKKDKPKRVKIIKPVGKKKVIKKLKPIITNSSAIEPNHRNNYRGNLDTIYGHPSTIHKHQDKYLVSVKLPYRLTIAWNFKQKVGTIRIHKLEADRYRYFFELIQKEFSSEEIKEYGLDLYGGSYSYRKIRGGNRYSTHAYGIAIDLNPSQNGLRVKYPKAIFSKNPLHNRLKKVTELTGLYNLGFKHGYDYMHFQTARR